MVDMPARGDAQDAVVQEAETISRPQLESNPLAIIEKHDEAQDNEINPIAEATFQSVAPVADTVPPPTKSPVAVTAETKSTQNVLSHKRNLTRPVVPIIPTKPVASSNHVTSPQSGISEHHLQPTLAPSTIEADISNDTPTDSTSQAAAEKPTETVVPAEKAAPKSWAELLRSKAAASSAAAAASPASGAVTNGIIAPKANSLADAVRLYDVNNESKISFLKPRGLVNTGNMCYMNAVSPRDCFFSTYIHNR